MKKELCIFLLIFFNMSSCVSIRKKNLVYHTIDINFNLNDNKRKKTILISNIEVLPPFDTKKICYSYRDYEVQNYLYHLWASPISNMLLSSLTLSKNPKSKIKFITPNLNNIYYSYELKIIVKKFLHRFYGEKSFAVVDIIFIISKRDVIKEKEYNIKVLCKENTPYGAVLAFNKALNKIINDFFSQLE